MSSLLGDLPESSSHRRWRWVGYFVIGIFFGVGPVVFSVVLLAIHHVEPVEKTWLTAAIAWVLCAGWTAHMGVNGNVMVPNRVFSLLVYLGYIFIGGTVGTEQACKAGINLFFPLVCIWFGERMGDYTGYLGNQPINQRSPGVIVIFLGWCIIIGVPIMSGVISMLI